MRLGNTRQVDDHWSYGRQLTTFREDWRTASRRHLDRVRQPDCIRDSCATLREETDICPHCGAEAEDEEHFLVRCEHLAAARLLPLGHDKMDYKW